MRIPARSLVVGSLAAVAVALSTGTASASTTSTDATGPVQDAVACTDQAVYEGTYPVWSGDPTFTQYPWWSAYYYGFYVAPNYANCMY